MVVPTGSLILDCGCGDGELSAYITTKPGVRGVIGIDRDTKMIDIAKRYETDSEIIPSLLFKLLDVSDINFSNQFHVLTCFWVMHWVASNQVSDVFKRFHEALKTGGELHLIIRLHGSVISQTDLELIQSEKWKKYFCDYRSEYNSFMLPDYKKALENAGFSGFDLTQTYTARRYFESDQDFLNYLLPITDMPSYIVDKDPVKQQELRNEFLRDVLVHFRRNLGLKPGEKIYTEVPVVIGCVQKPTANLDEMMVTVKLQAHHAAVERRRLTAKL